MYIRYYIKSIYVFIYGFYSIVQNEKLKLHSIILFIFNWLFVINREMRLTAYVNVKDSS